MKLLHTIFFNRITWKNINLTTIILLFLVVIQVGFANTTTSGEPSDNYKAVSLQDYLTAKGHTFDCYFTLESDSITSYHFNQLSGKRISDIVPDYLANKNVPNMNPSSISQLIDQLNAHLPDVDVYQDSENDKIIHLVARSLHANKNYILNQKINLNVKLIRQDLPNYIGKQLNISMKDLAYIISPQKEGGINQPKLFLANEESVREIFTQSINLSHYQRIIWTAEANLPIRGMFPNVRVEYYPKGGVLNSGKPQTVPTLR